MSKRYFDGEDNSASDAFYITIASFIISAIVMVLIVIASVVGAFVAVGIIWGTYISVANYVKGATLDIRQIRQSVSNTWGANVLNMQLFFDKARDYNHIMPKLVKVFLVMAGVGVIFVGTILIPVWMLMHSLIIVISLPFRKKKNKSFYTPNEEKPLPTGDNGLQYIRKDSRLQNKGFVEVRHP